MIVGDGKRVHFLAPNNSDPLPACLEGTKSRVAPNGFRRNPSMMKTHGKKSMDIYGSVLSRGTCLIGKQLFALLLDGIPLVCNGLKNNDQCLIYEVGSCYKTLKNTKIS